MSDDDDDELNDQLEDAGEEEEELQPSNSKKKSSKRKAVQQFFDEAAEDEDEDGEDEEEERGGERRYKKRSVFIDDIADVDDDEEEEEEDEEEAGDLIDDQDTVAEQAERSAADQARFRQLNRQQEEKSAEEIARHIEERYKAMEEGGPGYEDDDMLTGASGAVSQQAMLPTVNDPKLWMVRARAGHEREACIQILQKSYNMHRKGTPILVKSAFALDHLKEYVYIEAEKEVHVRDAIRGLRTVFISKGVRLVPLSQMVHAVTVNRTAKATISRGSWVRVRTGLYKDDLAHVEDIDAATSRAVIRLVPRLDLQAMASRAQDPEARKKNPFGRVGPVRPPAKPFNPEEARELALLVTRVPGVDGQTYLQLGSSRFINGFLEKSVVMRGLTPIDGVPPLEELQRYKACAMAADEEHGGAGVDGGDLSSLMAALPAGMTPKTTFVEGDLVMIVKGDLKNLEAEVETTREDGKIMVRPKVQDFNEAVDFDPDELRKVFKVGDRVRLISGSYSGETGMVLQTQDNDQAIVISDTTKQELKVFGRDLTRSNEPDTGVEALGEYQLHDLVLLDQSTAGVIIQIQRDAARVLTSASTPGVHDFRVVRAADIQRKLMAKNMVTTDAFRNQVRTDDLVTFQMGGPQNMKERTGTVQYIWRGMLFVKGKELLDAGGFEVVRACKAKVRGAPGSSADLARMVASGSHTPLRTPQSPGHGFTSRTPSFYAPASPGNFAPAPQAASNASTPRAGGFPAPGGFPPPGGRGAPMRPPAVGGFGRGRGAAANSLIGKTIRVKGGHYNGYRGRVKHETATHLQVEFDAISNRLVTVERCLAHDEATLMAPRPMAAPSQGPPRGGAPGGFQAPGGFGSRGPAPGGFGSRSGSDFGGPGAGGFPQTPMHHSMTPMHPSSTPAHAPYTPAYAPYTPMNVPTPTPGDDNDGMLGGVSGYLDDIRGATASTPGNYDSAPTPKAYTPSMYPANEPHHTAPTPSWQEQDLQGSMATADTPSLAPSSGGIHPTAPTPYFQHNTTAITPSLTPGGHGPTPGAYTGFTPAAQTPGMDLGIDLQGGGLLAGGLNGEDSEALQHWAGVVVQTPGGVGKSWIVKGAEPGGLLRVVEGHWGSRAFVEAGTEEVQDVGGVELARPNKRDRVRLVRAMLDEQAMFVGRTGTLIAMDSATEGIVKLDNGGEVVVLDVACVGKLGAQ